MGRMAAKGQQVNHLPNDGMEGVGEGEEEQEDAD